MEKLLFGAGLAALMMLFLLVMAHLQRTRSTAKGPGGGPDGGDCDGGDGGGGGD